MNGKYVVGIIVTSALVVGAAIYYLQVYAFYRQIDPASPEAVIRMALSDKAVADPVLPASDFSGIDADSSPLRYRSCFLTPTTLPLAEANFRPYAKPTPLVAPRWFDCFDADALDDDLASGAAKAFLVQENIYPGVDRVVALYPDGRAYGWQQLNDSADE